MYSCVLLEGIYPICTLISQPGLSWAGWVIQWIVNPLVLIGVPIACLLITIGIVSSTLRLTPGIGVRALAGSLLPFVALMFVFVFQGSLFADVASFGGMGGFFLSLALGFALPFLARLDSDLAAPLAAFCFSGVFSVLVFSYAAVRDTRIFVFYYGFALGVLAHVMVVGLPGDSVNTTTQSKPN